MKYFIDTGCRIGCKKRPKLEYQSNLFPSRKFVCTLKSDSQIDVKVSHAGLARWLSE